MIRVGQVVGAFGVDGAVKVMPLTDFEDRFQPGAELIVEGETCRVEWSRRRAPGLVVKLHGLDDRTRASLLQGRYLEVPESAARRLPPGSYYAHELVGLPVATESGTELGVLSDILERPANDVWVAHLGSIERLIPATREAVVAVDLEAGRILVADWLLEFEEA